MDYFVTVSYDLHGGRDADWDNLEAALLERQLYNRVISDDGRIVRLPHTTLAGIYSGMSSVAVEDYVRGVVIAEMTGLRLSGRVFVTASSQRTWHFAVHGDVPAHWRPQTPPQPRNRFLNP